MKNKFAKWCYKHGVFKSFVRSRCFIGTEYTTVIYTLFGEIVDSDGESVSCAEVLFGITDTQ